MNHKATGKIRILIVDDHPLVRERLVELINREPDLEVCGEAEDRQAALERIAAERPELAIVDLSLKSSLGLELIKDLQIVRVFGFFHAGQDFASILLDRAGPGQG